MKNNKMKTKATVLSLALAALLLSASNLNAQGKPGSLFGGPSADKRSEGSMLRGTVTAEGVGLGGAESENPTPVGGGIAILTAIGAGYALLKRKEDKQ